MSRKRSKFIDDEVESVDDYDEDEEANSDDDSFIDNSSDIVDHFSDDERNELSYEIDRARDTIEISEQMDRYKQTNHKTKVSKLHNHKASTMKKFPSIDNIHQIPQHVLHSREQHTDDNSLSMFPTDIKRPLSSSSPSSRKSNGISSSSPVVKIGAIFRLNGSELYRMKYYKQSALHIDSNGKHVIRDCSPDQLSTCTRIERKLNSKEYIDKGDYVFLFPTSSNICSPLLITRDLNVKLEKQPMKSIIEYIKTNNYSEMGNRLLSDPEWYEEHKAMYIRSLEIFHKELTKGENTRLKKLNKTLSDKQTVVSMDNVSNNVLNFTFAYLNDMLQSTDYGEILNEFNAFNEMYEHRKSTDDDYMEVIKSSSFKDVEPFIRTLSSVLPLISDKARLMVLDELNKKNTNKRVKKN